MPTCRIVFSARSRTTPSSADAVALPWRVERELRRERPLALHRPPPDDEDRWQDEQRGEERVDDGDGGQYTELTREIASARTPIPAVVVSMLPSSAPPVPPTVASSADRTRRSGRWSSGC